MKNGLVAEIPNLPASMQGLGQAQLVELCRFYRAHDILFFSFAFYAVTSSSNVQST